MHSGDDPSDSIEHLIARGVELQGAGRHDEALAQFAKVFAKDPSHPAAHLLASHSNLERGLVELGIAHARVAAAASPQSGAPWCNLAVGQQQLGRTREAMVAAKRAVALEPRDPAAWNALGLVEQDAGALGTARKNFQRALEIDPGHAASHLSLANLDQLEGHGDAALRGYARAQALDPAMAQAPYSRGHLFHNVTGDLEAAVASYREAIAIRSDYAAAHVNLAHALLLMGRFTEAWPEYRWRWHEFQWRKLRLQSDSSMAAADRTYEPPSQIPPRGSRLAIAYEQGLGDVLFFLRFAQQLREQGVVLEFSGDARLHGMLARTNLFDRLGSLDEKVRDDPVPQVLVGDLPLLLASIDRDPRPAPLALSAESSRVSALRTRLEQLGPAPYVGLAWRAGRQKTGPDELLLKELPLQALGAALKGVRATWICVQREPRSGEVHALSSAIGAPVHDLSAVNEDLEDLLALMTVLDGYVGVSSTSVHLRAAAGRNAHVLVPFPPEWRWMAAGDSPWFTDMRVYRQAAGGSWDEALARLADDLA